MITRDSWVWVLGFVAATLGYLITAQTPPTEWTYMQWLQSLTFVTAYLVGWFKSSPLAGAKDKLAETKTVLGVFSIKE